MYDSFVTQSNVSFHNNIHNFTHPLLPTLIKVLGKRTVFVAITPTILLVAASAAELLKMGKFKITPIVKVYQIEVYNDVQF